MDIHQTAFKQVKSFVNGGISLQALDYLKLESNPDSNAEREKFFLICDASPVDTGVWLG